VAATTYTTTQAATLATLSTFYRGLESLFAHLAAVKDQQNVNIIVTSIVLNGDNTVSITFTNALPFGSAEQLAHLGIH
jgi:hypothetical protein